MQKNIIAQLFFVLSIDFFVFSWVTLETMQEHKRKNFVKFSSKLLNVFL